MFSHTKWQLFTCERLTDAVSLIRSRPIGVVICREDVADGTWQDLVSQTAVAPNPPKIIVASAEPTTKLWNAALGAGADYVLRIPFNSFDVLRSISEAWHRWWFARVREARFDRRAVEEVLRPDKGGPERKKSQRVMTQVAGQLA
jgi:hypothetical protein